MRHWDRKFGFCLPGLLAAAAAAPPLSADQLLYRYEGDVLPYDPSADWAVYNPCEPPCAESLADGVYRLMWTRASDNVNFNYWVARPGKPYPGTFWVEWHFRSNHPLGRFFYGCDAWFHVFYAHTSAIVFMYGNAAISHSGDYAVVGLETAEFHTYRYESLDGVNYRISVDGRVFVTGSGPYTPRTYLQFGGQGGCVSDQFPNMQNEWDFVRFGTIGFGERVVATDPPAGFLDPDRYAGLDRFTVTFDSPNYVYIDDVTVDVRGTEPRSDEGEATEVRATKAEARTSHGATKGSEPGAPATGPDAASEGIESTIGNRQSTIHNSEFAILHSSIDPPRVIATRRLDNGPTEVVEVVLDRPLPPNARTRFLLDDGVIVNTISYTFIRGDHDADDDFDLQDFAAFMNCYGDSTAEGDSATPCSAFDFDESQSVYRTDFVELFTLLGEPQ